MKQQKHNMRRSLRFIVCLLWILVLWILVLVAWSIRNVSVTPHMPTSVKTKEIHMMEQSMTQKQANNTLINTNKDMKTRKEEAQSNTSIVGGKLVRNRNETGKNEMNRNVNSDRRLYAWAPGRLGNKLYNLACTYGLARTNHRRLVLPRELLNPIQRFLNSSYLDFEISSPPAGVTTKSGLSSKYVAELEHLPQQVKDIRVGPYVQVYKYFQPYETNVRKFMVVREDLVVSVQQFLRGLPHVSVNSTLVGIHIRRGDRTTIEGQVLPKADYLRQAMTYYLQKYHDVHFVVCSDSYDWCQRNETFLQPERLRDVAMGDYWVHYSRPSTTAEWDLALLSQCNHSIITVGTFGWWGAWIAGGETIYFKNPVMEGSVLAKRFVVDDIMWHSWIAMGDEEDEKASK